MRPLAILIGAALCGGGVLLSTGHVARAESGGAAILEVIAIKASKDPGVFDRRLISLKPDLDSLPYGSFTLLAARACTVTGGDRCGLRVLEDANLVIRTVENTPKYLRLNVLLNRNNRPVLDANLKINRNAGVVLTNMRREGPALVMSIKVRDQPQPSNALTSGR
jgi:hypothetical protein